jgi:3-oxoacyl-[acyl-carrier-protein] synthase-1
MNKAKVLVTGLSTVSSVGMDIDTTWQALLRGETGVRSVPQWEEQVEGQFIGAAVKDYQPRRMIPDPKWLKLISRQDVIGLNAAFQAIDQAGFISYRDSLESEAAKEAFNNGTGVYVGSAGNKFFQQYDFMPLFAQAEGKTTNFGAHLFETVHPMWLLKILPNNVLAYTGIQHGFKGPNQNVTNHAGSGLQAIIEAYWAIALGQADRAVVVAYDAATEPQSVSYYEQLGTISASGVVKPFDVNRDGTILGEGAAALVLESESAAQERGATCYAEILGGTSVSEAKGLFGLDETAEPLMRLMHSILEKSHLKPSDVGMVTAHANGNRQSDATEALAISSLFGENTVPVTGFKWSIGHTLCAAGLLDTALTIKALYEKTIPGIASFKQLSSDCQGISVSSKERSLDSSVALVLNRGFGGIDSGLLLKAYQDA